MMANEHVLWTGRPVMFRNAPISFSLAILLSPLGIGLVILLVWWLRCLGNRWTITSRCTTHRRGILSKSTTELRHVDIRAIHLAQDFFQRLMGTGTIRLSSASSEDFEIEIFGILKPEDVTSSLRGLQERGGILEPSLTPLSKSGEKHVESPVVYTDIAKSFGKVLNRCLGVIGNGMTRIVPHAISMGKLAVTQTRTVPGKVNQLLKSIAGEGNDLLYHFLQVIVITATVCGLGFIFFISIPCWYTWYGTLFILVGVASLVIGEITIGRNSSVGIRIASTGFLVLLIGLSITVLHASGWIIKQWEEKDIRLANEQVASHIKIAQEYFDKGKLDKAQSELKQIAQITKANDTKASDLLNDKIQIRRHELSVMEANREVHEYIRLAELDFSNDNLDALDAAEEKLTKALAVQNAIETAKAKDLLSKIPAKRQEVANKQVTKLVIIATESFNAGQFDKALQFAKEAISTQYATDIQDAKQLVNKIYNAQPELLFKEIQDVINQHNYSVAILYLKDYIDNPHSKQKSEASKLVKLVRYIIDDNLLSIYARTMSDEQIKTFLVSGKLPDELSTKNTTLNENVKVVLSKYALQERDNRKEQAEAIPAGVTYLIISENTDEPVYKQHIKRSVDVLIYQKVTEDVLRKIAIKIKNSDPNTYQRTLIGYFLPGMRTDGSQWCWATTHFDPNHEVRILGLSIDQEKVLNERPKSPSYKLIGTWLEGSFDLTRRITLFHENGRSFMETKYTDGEIVKEEVVERRSAAGRRFDTKKGSDEEGNYFLIDAKGNLQHWYRDGEHSTSIAESREN
jgi:hypothetical protein